MRFVITCAFAQSLVNFRGRLLEQIVANGHQVLALAPDFDQTTSTWCRQRHIEIRHIDIDNQTTNVVADAKAFFQILAAIKYFRPDVVFGYTHKPAIYTSIAAGFLRIPHKTMMVTGLGSGFEVATLKNRIVNTVIKGLFRFATRMSDRVIFHNPDDMKFFVKEGLLSDQSKAVVVNGSGVDLSLFPQQQFIACDASAITFLLVARIVTYKGIVEYATAATELKKNFPKARFLLAGYHDKSPSSLTPANWTFIQGAVEYLGKSDDVCGLMKQCHVYVLPSYGEGLPRTVLEAMACGRPVITTDVNGCRQTVIDGKTGFLVRPRDWQDLKSAMQKFLDGTADIHRMGQASHDFALSAFDVEQVNTHMLKALKLDAEQKTGSANLEL
jgi:glycosyltransferase involved in cell wall biosynthesis